MAWAWKRSGPGSRESAEVVKSYSLLVVCPRLPATPQCHLVGQRPALIALISPPLKDFS